MPIRRGDNHVCSILTEKQVSYIKAFYEMTEVRVRKDGEHVRRRIWTIAKLAKNFGVASCTIQRITSGQAWKHVKPCSYPPPEPK